MSLRTLRVAVMPRKLLRCKRSAPKHPIPPKFLGVVITANGTAAIRVSSGWQDFAAISARCGKKGAFDALDRWYSNATHVSASMADQLWPLPELPKVNVVLFTEPDEWSASILAAADPVGESASALSDDDIEAQLATFTIKYARVGEAALRDLRNRVARC